MNPAYLLIIGALLAPLLAPQPRRWMLVALPVVSLVQFCLIDSGSYGIITLLDWQLTTFRIDHLSFIFAVVFHIAAFIGALYAFHLDDPMQQVAGTVYAGAAIGATLAGDLITLFIYWELTAISSVFLIWAKRTPAAMSCGMRYLIIQVGSGVLLLAGIVVHASQTGSIAFDHIGLDSLAGWIILIAFGIKCAFPFMHNWLQDAYPQATVTGTVILSAFTTKLAVYALARSFAGETLLIYVGAVMTAFPIFFAVIENDLRRVLAYSLNNQLGFMVVGVGVGTELALNGTAAHAFAHIIYKALLFMSMGAVLYRVGTVKASDLGGLYKSMPLTAAFCIVGSASISAFPLLSGFVTKSMILTATADAHYWGVSLVLLFASAGVLDHSGIKIPYFSFFAHDSGLRCKEAPPHMLMAMGIAAFLCISIGIWPDPLYAILPFDIAYNAYSPTHVVTQMQLLLFSALAFVALVKWGVYPAELPSTNLDSDWLYRKLLPKVWGRVSGWAITTSATGRRIAVEGLSKGLKSGERLLGERSTLAQSSLSSDAVFAAVLLLAIVIIVSYFI